MAFEDGDKTTLIIKVRLFDWIIMPQRYKLAPSMYLFFNNT
jgi:hypothetical protein